MLQSRCLKSCALGVKTTLSCFEPRCWRFISILYQNECRIIMMDNVGMCHSVDALQPFVWLAGFFTLQRLSHLFWKARCRVKRILVADSGRGGSWKCQELRGADSSEVFRRRVVNNHWPSTISLWIFRNSSIQFTTVTTISLGFIPSDCSGRMGRMGRSSMLRGISPLQCSNFAAVTWLRAPWWKFRWMLGHWMGKAWNPKE